MYRIGFHNDIFLMWALNGVICMIKMLALNLHQTFDYCPDYVG